MSEKSTKRSFALVWFILFAVAIACMVFPTGIFYNRAAKGETINYAGLKCVFGGIPYPSEYGHGQVLSGFNVGLFIGFALPLVSVVFYAIFGSIMKKRWAVAIMAFGFLASFILLFCAVPLFAAVAGRDANQFAIGYGPVIGAIIGCVGFLISSIIGIRNIFVK